MSQPAESKDKAAATPRSITVTVLLFSVLREHTGCHRMRLHLPEPATAADVLDELARRFPVVDRYRPVLRLAVNEHYEPASVRLAEGDEVALITPVSGG